MPFNIPGVFEERVLTKGGLTRLVAPVGVTFKGGRPQGPRPGTPTKATIYSVEGPDIKFDVQGTGTLNAGADDSAAGGDGAASAAARPPDEPAETLRPGQRQRRHIRPPSWP